MPTVGNVIGTEDGSTLQSVDMASSHSHAGMIATDSDNDIDGNLTINGELAITTLSVSSVAITESADNFITVNTDEGDTTGGLEMYLSDVAGNNAKIQWNDTPKVWEMGNESGTMQTIAGVVERASDSWAETGDTVKTGTMGLDTDSGQVFVYAP